MKSLNLLIALMVSASGCCQTATSSIQSDFSESPTFQGELYEKENLRTMVSDSSIIQREYVINRSGMYVHGMAGTGSIKDHYQYAYGRSTSILLVGIRFGSKWYQKSGGNNKTGLHVQWLSMQAFNVGGNNLNLMVAPLNVGISHIVKLKESTAFEFNINTGYSRIFYSSEPHGNGLIINPEVIFRLKRAQFGLGYQYNMQVFDKNYNSKYSPKMSSIVLTIGLGSM